MQSLVAERCGRSSVRRFRDRSSRRLSGRPAGRRPHGRQPWRFVVIESLVRRTKLADAMAADCASGSSSWTGNRTTL